MRLLRPGKRGFTIIELLIVVAIMGILVAPLVKTEVFSSEGFARSAAGQDMSEEGGRLLSFMGRDLRRSLEIPARWKDYSLSPRCLIIGLPDAQWAVYDWDEENKKVFRRLYEGEGDGGPVEILNLARGVEDFSVDPAGPESRVFRVRVGLSREMLHKNAGLSLRGVFARRAP